MQHDELVYLGHMLDHARDARRYVAGIGRASFDQDPVLRLALTHLLQIIGEAASRVSAETRAAHPEIPWAQVIGMRHRIVHAYPDVDDGIIWNTITDDLPRLIDRLLSILPPHLHDRTEA